ncbi:MAG: hypothetical protein J5827_04155, partial [Oscillospiraceae bacterium]|nr:hypothetical protein [Oscillospiraceae bacterium]
MSSKALKSQLLAAVAMVLVAAIALGGSTFAWFVVNSSVTAKVSQISAQTNAGSLVIKYNATAVSSDLTADVASIESTPLYPAQWADNFKANGDPKGAEDGVYQFETGFASVVTAADLKADTLTAVGNPAAAVTGEYAVLNAFNVSAKGSNLSNLKVTAATISDAGNTNLDTALRVLVVCGENWVLCDKDGIVDSKSATEGFLASTVTAGADTAVNMYVFYDGNDTNIFTNNLPSLASA